MELPSTYQYKGWKIRYNLTRSNDFTIESPHSRSVVFVHGTPWSSIVFQPTVKALLAKGPYQILVYDLPGYGQSQTLDSSSHSDNSNDSSNKPLFPGDTSVKFQAEALSALLTHTSLPNPSIIAHDIAGAIVLRSHLLHKSNFSKILLVDTNAVLPWGDGFYKLVRSTPGPFLELPSGIFEAVVRAVVRSACFDPKVLGRGWEDALAAPWVGNASDGLGAGEAQRSFVRQIAQADDGDVREMLDGDLYSEMRCDVKIIWGEQDQWIPKNKIEELIERMKGRVKEFVVIPEAGHLVMLDQPERFAIEVFDWLRKS